MHIPSSASRHAPASPLGAGVISAGGRAMLVFSSRRALPRALARARVDTPGRTRRFRPAARRLDSRGTSASTRRAAIRVDRGSSPGPPGSPNRWSPHHRSNPVEFSSQTDRPVPPSATHRRLEGNHSRHGDRGVRRGLNPDRPANPAGPITGLGPPRPRAPFVALVSVRRQAHSAKATGVLGPTRAQPHRRGRRRAARR